MEATMKPVWSGLVELWCSWTHGGGHILRDTAGRVNWQCAKCGRWAEPVSEADEKAATDRASARGSAVRKADAK